MTHTAFAAMLALMGQYDDWNDLSDANTRLVRIASTNGFHWDLPPAYLDSQHTWHPVNHNPSPTHEHGQPNAHEPWLHPGGFDNVTGVRFEKKVWLPRGKKIRLFNGTVHRANHYIASQQAYPQIQWEYPENAVRLETSYVRGKKFLVRARIHGKSGEETRQYKFSDPPPGYVEPESCHKCHEDQGMHGSVLRPDDKNYYHSVRMFGLYPFEPPSGRGLPVWSDKYAELFDYSELEPDQKPNWAK